MKDFTLAERTIVDEVQPFTLSSPESIVQLIRATNYILDNGIPGAFVECGVYKGGNIVVMIRALMARNVTDRDIWLYDTFDGMPKPEDVDVEYGVGPASDTWSKNGGRENGSDWVRAPLGEVQATVAATDHRADCVKLVKGLVEDTIPAQVPQQIALLRLDTDFYRSTKHELMHLFPRLSRGGILIVDDYGAFAGCRMAVDEYFRDSGIPLFLGRSDPHVRIGVKI